MILIDTSVWVEVSRKGGDAALKDEVGGLLEVGGTAMAWPVWVELHQGAKGKREEDDLRGWRELSTWLDFDDECWMAAGEIGRGCLRAGVNVPFGDVLVFACSLRHGVEVLECDRHFAMIRKAVGP
jgi:predicted nucleic acid-binding protein